MNESKTDEVVVLPSQAADYKGPMTVVTKTSTYQFGAPDDNEERTVKKSSGSLPFGKCTIETLSVGHRMVICCGEKKWTTTTVREITPS